MASFDTGAHEPSVRLHVAAAIPFLALVLLGGCAPAVSVPVGPAPMTTAPTTPGPAASGTDLQSLIRTVSDDAARRSGVDASRVRILEAGAVTWSDGSLGCPEPDRMYTQALVPGFRIRIQAGSRLLVYHANARGNWVLCPADRARSPVGDGRA